MATVRMTKAGLWEVDLRSKLLPRRRSFTFDDETQARDFARRCDEYLKRGVVPPALAESKAPAISGLLGPVILAFLKTGQVAPTEVAVHNALFAEVGGTPLAQLNYAWCEEWVRKLKAEKNLAPGTIRKRVQALAKVIDWYIKQTPGALAGNPLRLLPKNYSAYSQADAQLVQAMDGQVKHDVTRDRRFKPGEEERLMAVLSGDKHPERERGISDPAGMRMLLLIILDTGARLREAYTVLRRYVDLDARVLTVRQSKVRGGKVVYRRIPLRPRLHAELTAWLQAHPGQPDDPLLPFWDGSWEEEGLKRLTGRLSARFSALFDQAQMPDFVEHDLRHEATCRWLEMRDASGHWVFRDQEINRIMGWSPRSPMAQRYASFRGEDLVARLWATEPGSAAGGTSAARLEP